MKHDIDRSEKVKFSVLEEIASIQYSGTLDAAMKHMREILAGASVVILLIAIVSGYVFYKDRQETKASLLLADAISNGQQTENETALLEKLVQRYRGSEASKEALLMLGALYRDRGETDKAIEAFSKAEKAFPKGNALFAVSSMGLGYLKEEKGLLEDAKRNFESASRNNAFKPQATLDLARVLAASGHKNEALKEYDRYLAFTKKPSQLGFVHYEVAELSKK